MLKLLISLISGVLLSLAFPRANLHWVGWFALTPLMYYTYRLTWKWSLLCGLVFGLGFFGSILHWIGIFGTLPWIALSIMQSLFIVLFVLLARLTGLKYGTWSRFIILPAVWVSVEWIRSLGMLGFTWGDIGYSQYKVLPIVQIASITGVWGVSFLLALANSALANLWRAKNPGPVYAQVALAVVIGLGVWAFGNDLLDSFTPEGEPIKTAVVQGNINPDAPQNYEYRERLWSKYSNLTLDTAEHGVELVVWPECVVPGYPALDPWVKRRLDGIATEANVYLLFGARDEDEDGRVYNSAFLMSPEGDMLGSYAKVHLVPFGEFVPARQIWPFLDRYRVTLWDSSPGSEFRTLDMGSIKIGTAICFESIFPYISRRLTLAGADSLCIITNDSWFNWSPAAEQHMAKSVFRAVENNRFLIRGAVTGISCFIDPRGRVVGKTALFEEAVIVGDVYPSSSLTFFTRHGDWLPPALLILAVTLGVLGRFLRKKEVEK